MLVSLSIRNVVLIDKLDLTFAPGLGVLTGETGAGKSILLDALGLALGARADAGLLRRGAEQATVSAAFEPEPGHPALDLLEAHDIAVEESLLVLRRVLGQDGRSRAFVNDQPVSVALLRRLGDSLVEVQGQFEQRGLMDPATHRDLLDAHGGALAEARKVAAGWHAWREALAAHREAEAALQQARHDEAFLRHAVEELNALDVRPDEEAGLAEQRSLLLNAEKLMQALSEAAGALAGESGRGGAEDAVADAQRLLERVADKAGGRLDPVLQALDRAAAELAEAQGALASVSAELELDPHRLSEIEERFFALKDMARKHGCTVAELPSLRDALAERLAGIDSGATRLEALAAAAAAARRDYLEAAEALSARRAKAARRLDAAVNAELPPLKLDKARFATRLHRQEEAGWGAQGLDQIAFEVATNPGAAPGPLGKIASGGELSRFLLALKVVLAEVSPVATLIFDEVDAGVGGATAAAVGARLARLAASRQVLVVTHSPQVAARGTHHWTVHKESVGDGALTRVAELTGASRREELARMLSGTEITDEARAAAERLMGAA